MRPTALITGASRGIGAACARALAEDGWRVVLNYRENGELARHLAAELDGIALQADVSDPEAVEEMFSVAGPVEALVCCAGISEKGLVTDTDNETWRRIFAVNMDGTFYCCRRALKTMLRLGKGSIVTMSSIWGVTGASCECAYSASKAAVIGFTKALAKEMGPSHIRVNCIAPGVIDTDMNRDLTPEILDALREETPLGTIGTPEDVASLAAYLVSDKARFITGQILGVNGGFVI